MFTGIVKQIGEIVRVEPRDDAKVFTILADKIAGNCQLGDSIAVNGCCLTVEQIVGLKLSFTAGLETLKNSTLANFRANTKVNLEPALTLTDRLGGHLVLGHIDGVASIININLNNTGAYEYTIQLPEGFSQYLAPKGSLAIDGVSLTVHKFTTNPTLVSFYIIPHTYFNSIFQYYSVGQKVNFEIDYLAKMVWHMLNNFQNKN